MQKLRITVVRGVFFMIVIRINVCYRVVIVGIDGDWICRYEQAAIEGGGRRRLGLRPAVVGGT